MCRVNPSAFQREMVAAKDSARVVAWSESRLGMWPADVPGCNAGQVGFALRQEETE